MGGIGRAVPGESQFRLDGEPPASGSNRDAHRRARRYSRSFCWYLVAPKDVRTSIAVCAPAAGGGTKDDEKDQGMAFHHAVKGANAEPIGSTQ